MSDKNQCKFCKKETTEDDFCFGCNSAICEDCDVNWDMPLGSSAECLHGVEPFRIMLKRIQRINSHNN